MEFKGPYKNYQVSSDYTGVFANEGAATWEDLGVLADGGSDLGTPSSEDFPLLDGAKRTLGEENVVKLAALDHSVVGVAAVKAGAIAGTKMWLRAVNDANQPRILGGADGCEVGYAEPAFAKKGQYVTPILTFSAASSQPGGTVQAA